MVEAAAFGEVIPDLEARHAAFRKELEEERARDHELESCDQDDLAQLQEAIIEQTCALSTFILTRSKNADKSRPDSEQLKLHERQSVEAQGHLADLNAKAADFEQQELASAKENDELRGMLELGRVSTQAEVSRLFGVSCPSFSHPITTDSPAKHQRNIKRCRRFTDGSSSRSPATRRACRTSTRSSFASSSREVRSPRRHSHHMPSLPRRTSSRASSPDSCSTRSTSTFNGCLTRPRQIGRAHV